MSKIEEFRRHGFDKTTNILFTRRYRVACSCCEALVINGMATHETGCPNARRECDGCGDLIANNRRYCDSCQ